MVADKIREGKGGLVVDTPIKLKVAQGHAKGIQISIATYKRHARIPQVNQKPDPRNSGHWPSCWGLFLTITMIKFSTNEKPPTWHSEIAWQPLVGFWLWLIVLDLGVLDERGTGT